MNQRFAVDSLTETDILRRVEVTIFNDRQPFIPGTDDLFTFQHNVNVEILTMIFRALLAQRPGMAFDDGKKHIITLDGIFPRRQRVRLLL